MKNGDQMRKKKTNQNLDTWKNLPSEELQKRIREEKTNARRSLQLSFTAFLAIIAICIAWFVSNTQVSLNGANMSADNNIPFELASVGTRQSAEMNLLKDTEDNHILSEGTKVSYDSYMDIENGTEKEISEKQDYYVGYSELAWYLDGQESVMPGTSGKLEFYLIPKQSGLSEVTISLEMLGYTKEGNRAVELDMPKIQNLLQGHILFFRQMDDTYGYHGWLGENDTFTVTAPNGKFSKNIPYKVTLYWIWPQYFRNYIYTQRSTEGDLFTDAMVKKYPEEYNEMISFLNSQKSVTGPQGKLFFDEEASDISAAINNTMSDDTLNTCNKYYNQADEQIGTKAKYIYVQIEVN